MKPATSGTPSKEIIDSDAVRSRGTEEAATERVRQRREQRDLEILNRNADQLNREVEEVLDYQAEL